MRNGSRPFTPGLRGRVETHVRLRRTIGTLNAFDPLRPFMTLWPVLLALLTVAAALEAFTAPVATFAAITTIAITIATVLPIAEAAIAAIVTIPVAAVAITAIPVVELTATALETLTAAAFVVAVLAFVARLRKLLWLCVAAEFAFIVAVVVAHRHRLTEAGRTRTPRAVLHLATTLGDLLFAERHDDAVIVLGVLEIVLGQHRVTRRLCVARESDVLFRNMGGRAPQLDVRARAFEAPRQRVLTLPILIVVIIIAVVAAASSAVLLSLPHGLHSRQVAKIMCCGAHAWQHAN
jgi:hypothetical protein